MDVDVSVSMNLVTSMGLVDDGLYVICIVAFQVEYFCHAFQTDVLESSEIR
jgi:hypothetical protein